MAVFPQKPRSGQKVLQGLYNSVCQIIDYLPSLEVRGDNSSTSVTKTSNGTIVHSNTGFDSIEDLRARYRFHNGIMAEDNKIYVRSTLTGGRFIDVDYYEQNEQGEEVEKEYPTINCMLSGGRDIQITQGGIINYTGSGGGGASGYTYTGDGDLGSGHIFVDYSYTNPVICSNLCYIDDLLNYPISGGGIGSELHFAQIRDIKDGAGTQVDYHWTSIGDSTEEGGQLIKFVDGVCVNLNVSGGTYITTNFHQGVGYGDYTSASIDCNLSGTYNWYPHTSGFIAIVPQTDANQNITGGIISTNLHAGSGIAIDPQTGEITCTIEGGGGSGGGNTYYADNFTLSTTSPTGNTFYLYDVYPLLTGRGGITVDRYGDSPLYPGYALGTVISCPVYLPSTGIAIIDDPTPGTQNKYVAITADFDYHAGTGISIDPATRTINCTVEPGGGGETYYADESTIKLSSTNNTFYLYDVEPLLTGAGGIRVYNYGTDGLGRRVTGISATPYTGGDNISVDNYVISMTATIPTKTSDLTNDSHFITINDVPPGSVYQGDNVTIAASGTNNNIFYVIDGVFAPLTTVVNLSTELSGHIDYVSSNFPISASEIINDVPFVTSSDLDAYYKVSAFNAVGDHLQYVPRLGRLNCTLTGGDWIQIDEQDNINCTLTNVSDLNNDAGYITTVDIPPSTTYIGTSGIVIEPILDENQQPTTSSFIGLSTVYDLLSEGPNIKLTKLIDGRTQISGTPEGSGGGGGGGCPWPNYNNLGEESNTLVYPLMRYSTSTGGWLRISCRGGTSRCVGVWIGDNYYGLGKGEAMTWSLAIPPASSFYVDVDWNLNNFIWFDSTVTPGTITIQQHDYWFTPPQWDPDRQTISEARDTFFNARSEETQCYNYMTGAATDLKQMSSDWTKLTMISGSDPYAEPESRQYYQDRITYMQNKLSGEYEGDWGCEQHWDQAIEYCQTLNTLNNSLPSANSMYSYQVTDIPAKCQQYYGKIEQYITSGQYYYNLVDQWWTQHDQQNQ